MRWYRGCLRLSALLIILFWALPALAQPTVAISALVQHPDQYDGKTVSVIGTITGYREHVSARGNPYTTFRLVDGGAVSVFIWKHQGLRDGIRVRVIGTFSKVRRVGRYTFFNEIEARRIEVVH